MFCKWVKKMKINETCEACLLSKHTNKYPRTAPVDKVAEYQNAVNAFVENNKDKSAPEIAAELDRIHFEFFGVKDDFSEDKKYYNELMLSLENDILRSVEKASDPLLMAVRYAMIGNFIDFGAMNNVDADKLRELLDGAYGIDVDMDVIESLREEIMRAGRMVYFTDNCGEIVADKALMNVIKNINPNINITAIVRGDPVFNDATMDDAIQVGLERVADEVFGNGSDIPGNVLDRVSERTLEAIKKSDFFISKGQGNYESLSDSGLNIYYIFMCKCSRFVEKFNRPLYSGMITKELN